MVIAENKEEEKEKLSCGWTHAVFFLLYMFTYTFEWWMFLEYIKWAHTHTLFTQSALGAHVYQRTYSYTHIQSYPYQVYILKMVNLSIDSHWLPVMLGERDSIFTKDCSHILLQCLLFSLYLSQSVLFSVL